MQQLIVSDHFIAGTITSAAATFLAASVVVGDSAEAATGEAQQDDQAWRRGKGLCPAEVIVLHWRNNSISLLPA